VFYSSVEPTSTTRERDPNAQLLKPALLGWLDAAIAAALR
jgi:hypothetical protein